MIWDERFGQLLTGTMISVICVAWVLAWWLAFRRMPVLLTLPQPPVRTRFQSAKSGRSYQSEGEHERKTLSKSESLQSFSAAGARSSDVISMVKIKSTRTKKSTSHTSSPVAGHAGGEEVSSSLARSLTLHTVGAASLGVDRLDDKVPKRILGPGRTNEGLAAYQQSLQRQQIFCILATSAAICFVVSSLMAEKPGDELLVSFSAAHQVVFAMALGHWCNMFIEDYQSHHFLALGFAHVRYILSSSDYVCPYPSLTLHCMYSLYYAIALFTYSFILYSHSLGGVGVVGLLFEAPLVMLIRHELAWTAEAIPPWMKDPEKVRIHWRLTVGLFLATRGLGSVLWLVTLIPGFGISFLEKNLDRVELVIYMTLGFVWTCFNLWFFGLVIRTTSVTFGLLQSKGNVDHDVAERISSSSSYFGRSNSGSFGRVSLGGGAGRGPSEFDNVSAEAGPFASESSAGFEQAKSSERLHRATLTNAANPRDNSPPPDLATGDQRRPIGKEFVESPA